MSRSHHGKFTWDKVIKQDDGCWVWTGATNGLGYGIASLDGKGYVVHRLVWLMYHDHIPEETLDHLCRVRLCVNPLHLEPVSRRENSRRAADYQWNGRVEDYPRSARYKKRENVPNWLKEYLISY